MSLKKFICFFYVVLLAFIACKKKNDPVPKTSTDVYIAGNIAAANGNTVATYWKNGTAVRLVDSSNRSTANAIAVNGNDVYVAGTITIANKIIAAYWKNGVLTQLTNGNSGYASANGIAISGNDVYVAGDAVNGNDIIVEGPTGLGATYWKNGVATKLPDSAAFGGHGINGSSANGIAINNNDVYISGNISGIITSGPTYWKNGAAISLSDGTYAQKATSIALNGADVYVGGTTNSKDITYWKNGLATAIQVNPYAGPAYAISVKNNDVYLAGISSGNNNDLVATYWKNGIATKFADGTGTTGYIGFVSIATGIAVLGNDVYVCGFLTDNLFDDAAYWKNGVITHLAKNSQATGIVVVSH